MSIETEFEKSINSPHDAVIKKILQKIELAKSFFRHYFPKEIVKHINFDLLELSNKSYVDEKLKEKILELALRYTYHARNEDEETVKKYIEEGIDYFDDIKAREVAVTVAEQIRQKALTEGKIRTGGIILKQIKKRFGSISPFLEQRLMQSDFDILDKFGESIFDFKNLTDAEKWWETQGTEH